MTVLKNCGSYISNNSLSVNSSTFVALLLALFFWIFVTGFSTPQALISVLVIACIGIWGFLLIAILAPGLPDVSDTSFWLLGPCLGIGAMLLFILRLLAGVIFLDFCELTDVHRAVDKYLEGLSISGVKVHDSSSLSYFSY